MQWRFLFAFISIILGLAVSSVQASNTCAPIFGPPSAQELSNMFEERVYAVHITKFLPTTGFLKAVSKDRGRFMPTVHFSLGEPVVDHPWGKWSEKPYAVVMPVKNLRDQMVNLFPQDTYVVGDVKIPHDAVLFLPEGESLPATIKNKVIRYKTEDGVKSAISKFLKEINSIEFTTESWTRNPHLGTVDIMEGRRLQRIFQNLFRDKPYLTRVPHASTAWGQIDSAMISLVGNWVNNLVPYKYADFDIQMAIYQFHDSIYGISSVTKKMNLPVHAKDSLSESLKELKSYLSLLEVEKSLRAQGVSMFALDPVAAKAQVTEILSRRYNRTKLLAYVNSVKGDLPTMAEKKYDRRPEDFYRSMSHTPMNLFIKRLAQEFQGAGPEVQARVRAVTALRSVEQVVAGHITAEQALASFKGNAESLTKTDITMSKDALLNLVHEVNSQNFRYRKYLNTEVLLFLRDPDVQRFLEERGAFQYFSAQEKADYDQTLKATVRNQ